MRQSEDVPVLVLGARITALGVVRTLGRARIANYLVGREPDFTRWSRFHHPLPTEFNWAPEPHELAEWLESIPLERAVLLPCADDWVQVVAGLPPELRNRFQASIADGEAIASLVDKGRFAGLLRKHCIPHPRTTLIDSPGDLDGLLQGQLNGFFLKPRSSQDFYSQYGVKAFRIAERKAAVRLAGDAVAHGIPLMLQEYIPGPPTAHCFIDGFMDRNGEIPALFARRRIRMYPADFGNSSLHESVPVEAVKPAADALQGLLRAANYRGIFSGEFKYDSRDGKFKILEVNARPWWYVEFAAASGVDVCTMAYRDALGLPCEPVCSYRAGRRCVTLDLDLKACLRLRQQQQLSFGRWIRSWLGADHPVFAWSDPGPAMKMLFDIVGPRLTSESREAP